MGIDAVVTLFSTVIVLFALIFKNSYDVGLLTLSISIICDVVAFFGFSFKLFIENETLMISSQRLCKMTEIDQEGFFIKEGNSSLKNWP